MSLTEVVFELSDPQHPLCRFTREPGGTRAVYRVIDPGTGSGTFRAMLTLLGTAEATQGLVRDFRATQRYDDVEVLVSTPESVLARVTRRVADGAAAAAEPFLDAFGPDAVLDPVVGEAGRLRVRALLPVPLDTKRVVVRLQDLQRELAWEEFRVVRVGEIPAREYVEVLRRILTLDQEDMLRLALGLGYYDSPKRCNLGDIAERLGVSISPVHKKLKEIEQRLINAHVDPALVSKPDARRLGKGFAALFPAPVTGLVVEVSLRGRWDGYAPLAFTARHADARVVLQHLGEDERTGTASALLVLAAPERDHPDFLAALDATRAILATDVASRSSDHLSVRLQTTSPTADTWASHANPFVHLLRLFGRDAYMKPVLMEGGDLWMRFVVMRHTTDAEVRARLDQAATAAKWNALDVLATRRIDLDPAMTPLPAPERMTPRQREVLKVAHALGYYRTPRRCRLEDVANALGISANAIHKNLTAAEQKIICGYLSAGT